MTAADDNLPQVAGRLSISLAAFMLRARVLMRDEQEKPNPDSALIGHLADGIRMARETAQMIGEPIERLLLTDLIEAIRDEGPNPQHHETIMNQHRAEWPTLWKALDQILASRALAINVTDGPAPLLILMEPTQELTKMQGVPVRVWEGETMDGVKLFALIARIAVAIEQDQTAFQRALEESAPPKALAIDMRMIL